MPTRRRSSKDPTLRGLRYLYIVECDGRFKIGVAADPAQRLATLQVASPFRLYLRAVFPCPGREAPRLESGAHQLLRPHRLLGEWFACSFELADDAVRRTFLRCGVPALTLQDVASRLGDLHLASNAHRSRVGKAVAKDRVAQMNRLASEAES